MIWPEFIIFPHSVSAFCFFRWTVTLTGRALSAVTLVSDVKERLVEVTLDFFALVQFYEWALLVEVSVAVMQQCWCIVGVVAEGAFSEVICTTGHPILYHCWFQWPWQLGGVGT